ncbi:hypothetical protein [Asticcacaulis benevestitus]|uniref:hypothetical protein n=1 Tax=Asticcacaulis benevestitus TaxID=347481 RepID=UPI00039CCA00|nr:hypothetical protein [Asticcacaulis benevestitus]
MLKAYLDALIQMGRLTVRVNPNRTYHFGTTDPEHPERDVAIWFDRPWTAFKVGMHPYLYFGEAFMEGDLIIEKGLAVEPDGTDRHQPEKRTGSRLRGPRTAQAEKFSAQSFLDRLARQCSAPLRPV